MLLSEGFWMLLDASAGPRQLSPLSLPPCPFVAPSYKLALQSICSPVSITIQQRQEELPLTNSRQ